MSELPDYRNVWILLKGQTYCLKNGVYGGNAVFLELKKEWEKMCLSVIHDDLKRLVDLLALLHK